MIDHISLGVRNMAKSKRFYDERSSRWATPA